MKKLLTNKILVLSLLALCLCVLSIVFIVKQNTIDFNADVKPIINKKCITCHGGVKREGGFSLLFRKDALEKTESGKYAIVPGDAGQSEMIRRILSNDPEERMPHKGQPLSEDEISILKNWIDQGAEWGNHWAYVKVAPPALKAIKAGLTENEEWGNNSIDDYILEKLKEQKFSPSAEAEKSTLLRRVSLDLIGIPAPESLRNQFMKSADPKAYGILVDSLLALPQFGERWTSMWLDLARYADTKGYERDDSRSIWRYRDWLIKSFNSDMPYNQFLTEQLAGDLLPNPTDDQYIATAFHRNTMTNDEGGTENEEFRTAAVLDRVNSTWEGLMGTTFACVQCHSHPYDPFRHEEYYKFMAFFNNTRDEDSYADYPRLRHFSAEDEATLSSIKKWIEKNASSKKVNEVNTFLKTWQPAVNSLLADQFVNSELSDSKWLIFRNHTQCRLKNVELTEKNELIFRAITMVKGGIWTIHLDKPDGPVLKNISIDQTTKDWTIHRLDFEPRTGVHDLFFTYVNPNLKNAEASGIMFDWLYFTSAFPGKEKDGYVNMNNQYWTLLTKDVPSTPIMMENPPDMMRTSNVFERGNWLVKGEKVTPAVPLSLNPMPANSPNNRLGLAQWMTSEDNPLTSRTMVNRIWEQLFGTGLAETLEDLGTQGLPPSHRELLDYLSWNYMHDWKWSTKRLMKEIVMSATYRQDSKVTDEMLAKDAANKFYARAPRVRLSAEQVRDQSLEVSGLLSKKMYGPSVMPFQPGGIWLSPWNGQSWKRSEGEDQHRRALYTYWKRTAPYPSMMSFDGASREVCTSRRIRTNTPLQALVTLNDSAFVEISKHFAHRMKTGGSTIDEQLNYGYQLAFGHGISSAQKDILKKFYDHTIVIMKKDSDRQKKLLLGEKTDPEIAALVVVANAMLNLDEFITKN